MTQLKPLRFATTSFESVRYHTSDDELPVRVVIERSAIDDYFEFQSATSDQRKRAMDENLAAIESIVKSKYAQRGWTEGQDNISGRYRQIRINLTDLRQVSLKLPPEN